jgi:serine/threonine protein kinase
MEGGTGERGGAAVLIGIGEYLHTQQVWPLCYAARDAEAMAGVLSDPELCSFPAHKVKLLTDQSASRDTVAHHLSKWLPEQARGAEIALIYFAGHGMIHRIGQRDEGYLLPYDADPDDIVTRGLLMTDLARWIEAVDAGTVIVCLDCCHAAKVLPRGGTTPRSLGRDMRIRPAMLQELTGRGRYLIASCDDGQVSLEADTWEHGLFTYHLLQGIRGAGDRDGDGRIGVTELFEYVAEAVERDARAAGTTQRPWSCSIGPGGVILSIRPQLSLLDTPYPAEAKAHAVGDKTRKFDDGSGVEPVELTIARLEAYRRSRDPAGIPDVFLGLVHDSKEVRERAKMAVRAFGWEKTSAAVLELGRQGAANQVRPILEGLAAFESHKDVVVLLDRLVNLLTGDLRNQAILMLERKRLVLDMEKTVAVFQAIHSPYRISRVLGQGLFTSAYAARDEEDGLDVVVRVLRPEFAGQPQIRTKFLDLNRNARRFVHQNLVLTREVRAVPEHELYFVVRDHVDGVTLQSLLNTGTSFSADQIGRILGQIAAALAPLHRAAVVHGGIKPSNIFLGGGDHAVLGDPALPVHALGASLERLTYDYRYAAPELFEGSGTVGPPSDLYSMGCVAYELTCGHPPFVADNPFELAGKHLREPLERPGLDRSPFSRSVRALLVKLLAKSPAERFTSIDQVARALEGLAEFGGTIPYMAPEAPSARFSSAVRHEEAVSIVSFDPNTIAPSLGSIVPNVDSDRQRVPERLGRYEIIRRLGKGGMGTVYLALDVELNRQVALKVIEGMSGAGASQLVRFQREAQAAARLALPGIIQIYDVGEQDGVPYLTLEYVGGGSLSQLLRAEGPMAPAQAARLVLQLARSVHAVHDMGIIHRDLKPSNVLLTENGLPKISDFGLAKLVDQTSEEEGSVTRLGQALGTPGYMAPEQVRGEHHMVGPATDVYGLGTILYACLTARSPFQGASMSVAYQIAMERSPPPPRQIRPEVPISLERICLRCLEKVPRDRYAGANQLAQALEQFLVGEGPEQRTDDAPTGEEEPPHEGRLTPSPRAERPRQTARRAVWAWVRRWFVIK